MATQDVPFQTTVRDGVPEVLCKELYRCIDLASEGKLQLIDVRRPDEYVGELGHIEGAILKTLGPELTSYLEKADREKVTVFICRSGARSAAATLESLQMGYPRAFNMAGGMLQWNADQFEVKKGG